MSMKMVFDMASKPPNMAQNAKTKATEKERELERAKAQAAKERDARERISAYTIPPLAHSEDYSQGGGSSGIKERRARDTKNTHTRQASAYVEGYFEDDEEVAVSQIQW